MDHIATEQFGTTMKKAEWYSSSPLEIFLCPLTAECTEKGLELCVVYRVVTYTIDRYLRLQRESTQQLGLAGCQ